MDDKTKTGGLAGIIAADSAICLCSAEDKSLLYRGYAIEDLAAHATFEEVAWLLLRGELPTEEELISYKASLQALRYLPSGLKDVLEKIPPDAHMMDVLRTGCSALGNFEPESPQLPPFAIADRLIACLSSILLYWLLFHQTGQRPTIDSEEDTLAGHILHLTLGKKPDEIHKRCLDVSLILYAEHEFNASTFTVRTIASTLSDFYSAITGGMGALRGPLHGGANEAALELITSFEGPDQAEMGVLELLDKKQLIMGFGHRVYTQGDPRSAIIKAWSKKMSQFTGDTRIFAISERIEQVMLREKKIFPNLDFYSSSAYHFLGIPTPMFTPLFALARIAGWSAHLLEQRAHNKLIRPLSHYIGPPLKKWIYLTDRKMRVLAKE